MKQGIIQTIVLILIMVSCLSCGKKNELEIWPGDEQYYVEGILLSKKSGQPVVGRAIAISQKIRVYNQTDPFCITDTSGHFKIYYSPSGSKEGLNIYPKYEDYDCIYSDISFISNIPKGQNINLKKVYSSIY